MLDLSVASPAINANDCVMKFKFETFRVYGYHHSLNDNIMRTTDVMIGRKRALVCRYCDVSECCSFDLRDSSARVLIADCDPSVATPEDVNPNPVSKPVVTGNALPCDGDKCAPAFLRKGDRFDD